jgi:DNA-binding CsgD family transcriptional regulator
MIASLTPRENQIANLILDEKSNASIAIELCISERTVETHRKSIYSKTGVKTVVGLVKMMLNKNY